MDKKVKRISFVEYLADNLLDTDYDNMSSRADLEAESMAETLHENLCYTAKDGTKYEVEMTDHEWLRFTDYMKDFVQEFYDDAVKIVDEANENAREWEEARQEGLKGNY